MICENNKNHKTVHLNKKEILLLKNILDDALSIYNEYLVDNEETDFAYELSIDLNTFDNLTISSNKV
ncbi:excisionase [Staphylococcus epidermidis]|uniref:excisionase n=1 Tax=Staphylococcus epidermidis TaxID=1282 RepID=UPI00402B43C6